MKGTDGVKYMAKAGWYSGGDWIVSLSKGFTPRQCEGDTFTWNGTGDFWKVKVPRTCLDDLTNRIRVRAEMYSYDDEAPGVAGWTLALARG